MVLRARELFHGRGEKSGDNGEESGALDQVMYALHALRRQLLKHLGVAKPFDHEQNVQTTIRLSLPLGR